MMPTDEQIEAVARALESGSWDSFYDDFPPDDWHQVKRRQSLTKARDILVAYEATRPEVPSDAELIDQAWDAFRAYYETASLDPDLFTQQQRMARALEIAIRAVRERLGGVPSDADAREQLTAHLIAEADGDSTTTWFASFVWNDGEIGEHYPLSYWIRERAAAVRNALESEGV